MKRLIDFRSSKTRMFALCIVDILTIILNSYLSLILRYSGHYAWIRPDYIDTIHSYMLINIITTIIIFWILNLYNSVWSFASVREVALIVGACALSSAFQALGMQFMLLKVPRSYYIFYFFLMVMTTGITRFSYRIYHLLRQG